MPAAAGCAATFSSSAAGASARAGTSLSSVVRAVLRDASASGGVMRLSAVWAAVRARAPAELAAVSKTHFKRRVVAAMAARGDLVKTHVFERDGGGGAAAPSRDFFAFRLKNTRRNFPGAAAAAAAAAPQPPLR